MRIECVCPDQLSENQLVAWRNLQTDLYDHPFFAPEYTFLVSEVRDDVRVAIIETDETTGFFPFHIGSRGLGSPVGMRLTDFQGPIVQNCDLDIAQLLRACGLRRWHFDHLVPSCASLQNYCYDQSGSPYMDLNGGYDAYRERRRQAGSSTIKQFERKARKMDREVGPLRFELHTTCHQVFETLIQWKIEYIRQKAAYPLLDIPWVIDLLERIRQTDTPGFVGRLSALYAGDQLVGAHLGICNDRVCHWWITAYDVQYQKYSPGGILLLRLAESAASAGITRLDLGKGDETYKQRLMSGEIPLGEGMLTRSPVHQMLGRAWYHSQSKLRQSALQPLVQQSKRLIRYGPWNPLSS